MEGCGDGVRVEGCGGGVSWRGAVAGCEWRGASEGVCVEIREESECTHSRHLLDRVCEAIPLRVICLRRLPDQPAQLARHYLAAPFLLENRQHVDELYLLRGRGRRGGGKDAVAREEGASERGKERGRERERELELESGSAP